MYIPFLIIISILSLFPIGEKIASKILPNKKIISGVLYFLSVASLLFLTNIHAVKDTGEYAIWLLWLLLWLPILSKVFGLVIPQKLMIFRKELGILMGVIAMVHSTQYFMDEYSYWFWEKEFWIDGGGEITYLAMGMIALVPTILLTITSNNWSIKKMKKSWKILHRSVYAIMIFTLLHVAFLKMGKNGVMAIVETFIPFVLYTAGKIAEWKGVKINIKESLNNFLNS